MIRCAAAARRPSRTASWTPARSAAWLRPRPAGSRRSCPAGSLHPAFCGVQRRGVQRRFVLSISSSTLRGRCRHRPHTEPLFAVGSTADPRPDTLRRGGRRPAALGRRGALVRRRLRLRSHRCRRPPGGRRCRRPLSAASSAVSTAAGSASETPSASASSASTSSASTSSTVSSSAEPISSAMSTAAPDSSVTVAARDGRDQRLAAPHVGVDRAELARLLDAADELLRRHLVLLGLGDDPLGELLVVDRHLLLLGERVQDEPGLDVALGLGAQRPRRTPRASCPGRRGTARTGRRRGRRRARRRARATRPRRRRRSPAAAPRWRRRAPRAPCRGPGRPGPCA